MILSKKIKVGLLAISVISLVQMPTVVSAKYLTNSESSMLATSLVVISVAAIPVVLPIESSKGMSSASENASTSDKDDDQFVYIHAKDENGNPVQLKLPKEAQDRVQINPDDKIKLEAGEKDESVLYINGEPKHLFIKSNDANILQHKAL